MVAKYQVIAIYVNVLKKQVVKILVTFLVPGGATSKVLTESLHFLLTITLNLFLMSMVCQSILEYDFTVLNCKNSRQDLCFSL